MTRCLIVGGPGYLICGEVSSGAAIAGSATPEAIAPISSRLERVISYSLYYLRRDITASRERQTQIIVLGPQIGALDSCHSCSSATGREFALARASGRRSQTGQLRSVTIPKCLR